MFSLTRQEKLVILFFLAIFLLGIGANHFKNSFLITKSNAISNMVAEGDYQLPRIEKVNINKAGFRELTTIRGIGAKTAQRIIEHRLSKGPFYTIEDIQKVKGIGPKKFESIRDRITAE